MTNRFVPLYHGVMDRQDYERDAFEQQFQKHLPEDEFESQVAWLCASFEVLTVDEFVDSAVLGKSAAPAALLTFDDVYANFHTKALPIIERHGCPVTLFLCTGFATGQVVSWTDEIERLVINTDKAEVEVLDHRFQTHSAVARHECVLQLKTLLQSLPTPVQKAAIARLLADYDTGASLPKAEMLSWDAYCDLRDHPLVTVCHHSHSHSVMLKETSGRMLADLEENVRLLGAPQYFAYPWGVADVHFDERVKSCVQQQGFRAAFSVEETPTYDDIDPFAIPRKEMRVGDHLEMLTAAGRLS